MVCIDTYTIYVIRLSALFVVVLKSPHGLWALGVICRMLVPMDEDLLVNADPNKVY